MLMGKVRAEGLMRALDPDVRASLSPEQEAAIRQAAHLDSWVERPVDIRFSFSLGFDRFFLTLLAGPERRSHARLLAERGRHPFSGPGNLLTIAIITAICGLAGLAIVLLANGVQLP